jgi:hypothetical protein
MFKKTLLASALVGSFAFVAQAGCPQGTTAGQVVNGKETCVLAGTYSNSDLVLTADKNWVLNGGVFIGGDNTKSSTLRIQPGTKIVGMSGADYLVINRGSQIFAEGTASKPIVLTAAKSKDRRRGEWGGLIINGNAPVNGCGLEDDATAGTRFCELEGEGNTGKYGGDNPLDNSGVLKYVRVEFAGYEITPDNELNGIAFQGVGSGTEVDFVQVHMNADDGVEFFGGTVNVRHILVTGARDDSVDWTAGWRGKAQFVIIEQYGDQANNGIEADNNGKKLNSYPRSMPTISNMTLLGTSASAAKGGEGVLLRKGTGAKIHNSVILGAKKSCLDIDNDETFANMDSSEGIVFENTYLSCAKNFSDDSDNKINLQPWFLNGVGNKVFADVSEFNLNGWVPSVGSVLLENGLEPDDDELWFEPVEFIGAVESAATDWTAGWTTDAKN